MPWLALNLSSRSFPLVPSPSDWNQNPLSLGVNTVLRGWPWLAISPKSYWCRTVLNMKKGFTHHHISKTMEMGMVIFLLIALVSAGSASLFSLPSFIEKSVVSSIPEEP